MPNRQRSKFDTPATVNTAAEAQVIQQLIKSSVSISPSDVSSEISATLMSPQEGSNFFLFPFFFHHLSTSTSFLHRDEKVDSPCARLPTQTGSQCLISDK